MSTQNVCRDLYCTRGDKHRVTSVPRIPAMRLQRRTAGTSIYRTALSRGAKLLSPPCTIILDGASGLACDWGPFGTAFTGVILRARAFLRGPKDLTLLGSNTGTFCPLLFHSSISSSSARTDESVFAIVFVTFASGESQESQRRVMSGGAPSCSLIGGQAAISSAILEHSS